MIYEIRVSSTVIANQYSYGTGACKIIDDRLPGNAYLVAATYNEEEDVVIYRFRVDEQVKELCPVFE